MQKDMDRNYVENIISEIQGSRVGMDPSYVLLKEVSSRVHDDLLALLRQMIKDGDISWSRTINDVGISLTKR